MKRILPVLLIMMLFLLNGCRSRTTAPEVDYRREGRMTETGAGDGNGTGSDGIGYSDGMTETGMSGDSADAVTVENPESGFRTYDENASAEVVPGANHQLWAAGENEGTAGLPGAEESPREDQLREEGTRTATQTVSAEEAERLGTGEDAESADTMLLYYTVLLEERLGSLFECQRRELYWEMPEEFRTVYKTSEEHKLILQAGCYDVSNRLLEENLLVNPGWVKRKEPGMIVKITDRNILGFGNNGENAEKLYESLIRRPEWNEIDAVKNKRLILISEQMLTSQHLRTGAVLAIAKVAYPDLFADVDITEAILALAQEAAGVPAEGKLVLFPE